MKRRKFIRNTAMGATLPFWMQQCQLSKPSFPIDVHSDQTTGHLVFESHTWARGDTRSYDIVIVGGGLAGLAAAYQVRGSDCALFELSDRLGGTSGSVQMGPLHFCQGAHYDLDYPHYYGEEVIRMLEELEIVHYQPWKKAWSFKDDRHIIPHTRRQQCYEDGEIREDVIPEGPTKAKFLEILDQYEGRMGLPTRLIDEDLRPLNDRSFLNFLSSEMDVSEEFERQLDYHMMDDYGGTAGQVSALAGIHYFKCRPYYLKPVSLFSPPRGNDYFVQKIARRLPPSTLHLRHLVRRIEEQGAGFKLEVVDIANRKVHEVQAGEVIYAGQKHALQYVFPEDYPLFSSNTYAPWMIVNLVTPQQKGAYGYWQNEFLGQEKSFLGFIDSSVQDRESLNDKRIFTAYYCLRPEDREYLSDIAEKKEQIVAETLKHVRDMLRQRPDVESTFINVMGHAMPIPTQGYLFQDANEKNARLKYAGVDNGRLPLLYEALDSGLQAGSLV